MHKFDCHHDAFVESCPSCMELAAIERAFVEDRDALIRDAQIPSSAIVWWRAQIRSRREAARVATEPITLVQGIVLACAAGLLVAAVGFFSPTFLNALEWAMGTSLPTPSFSLPSLPASDGQPASPVVIAAIAAIGLSAIVLPLALYFTFHEGE